MKLTAIHIRKFEKICDDITRMLWGGTAIGKHTLIYDYTEEQQVRILNGLKALRGEIGSLENWITGKFEPLQDPPEKNEEQGE